MTDASSQIMFLKVSTTQREIIAYIQRFERFLNENLQKARSPLFLEFFDNGFIIFGTTEQNIIKIYQERSNLFKKIQPDQINFQENIFFKLSDIIAFFPKSGLIFLIEFPNNNANSIMTLLQENYRYIHSDIHFLPINSQSFQIVFESPEALMAYAGYIQYYAEYFSKK
ncbi:hypothetical protein [Candidatus Harpocratesius sp.]